MMARLVCGVGSRETAEAVAQGLEKAGWRTSVVEQVGLGRWGVEMEIRKEEIKLRVTRDEKEMIEAAAARAGVPVAAWVRMVALQEVRKTVLRERKEER